MGSVNLPSLVSFALELAKQAESEILSRYFNHSVMIKDDGTEVTLADQKAEAVMRELIQTRYPEHGILGEELGEQTSQSPYQWILDPVDGTTWFTLGVPLFGTLIGLVEAGEPLLGVIHMPVAQETIYAARGLGCWFKAKMSDPVQLHVCPSRPLAQATVSASGVHCSTLKRVPDQVAYPLPQVIQASKQFDFCGDCGQHALVCRGKIHAAIDTEMKPWDIAAVVPCIEEAGGYVTTLSGQRENIIDGGSLLSSCGGSLHYEILDLLQLEAPN